ncbi:AAA family ATPase [Methanomicrobium antiquum]|uniref:AAA family ATPase n=1 Tax=Methanomicrobium antiquum TaxID=487686 RepID=A0AAF0FP71_9EURY|nr:AAA family ATPase [Methanomicrobium antiquum]WFN37908.1 AAA family ATPase [Methanomicrobium antiquum]
MLKVLTLLTYGKVEKTLVILFYGPSGVGKTETAKYLAEILGGELYRKEFSMFQGNEYLSFLFGV